MNNAPKDYHGEFIEIVRELARIRGILYVLIAINGGLLSILIHILRAIC